MVKLKKERAEFIAKVRHIAWISYQIATGQEYNVEIYEDQMSSLLDGIEHLDIHPEATAEMNHENWVRLKKAQGWVYGEAQDFEKKTHPDLVPYEKLPAIERRKDFTEIVIQLEADRLWKEVSISRRRRNLLRFK